MTFNEYSKEHDATVRFLIDMLIDMGKKSHFVYDAAIQKKKKDAQNLLKDYDPVYTHRMAASYLKEVNVKLLASRSTWQKVTGFFLGDQYYDTDTLSIEIYPLLEMVVAAEVPLGHSDDLFLQSYGYAFGKVGYDNPPTLPTLTELMPEFKIETSIDGQFVVLQKESEPFTTLVPTAGIYSVATTGFIEEPMSCKEPMLFSELAMQRYSNPDMPLRWEELSEPISLESLIGEYRTKTVNGRPEVTLASGVKWPVAELERVIASQYRYISWRLILRQYALPVSNFEV